jgi:phosphomannomutase
MGRLRAAPPAALAGRPVTSSEDLAAGADATAGANLPAGADSPAGADAAGAAGGAREPGLPPADVLIYRLPGARVVIRPSGTEPKLKAYLEVVEPATPRTLAAARVVAAARLGRLRAAVADLVAEG